MANERGVFAVDRGVFDHPLFANEAFTEREAWLWLVGQAAWRETRVRVGHTVFNLARGQCAYSVRFLATKWQWEPTRVHRFLKKLKSDTMIATEVQRDATQITICNYEKYAFDGNARATPIATPAATEVQRSRNKEEEPKNLINKNTSLREMSRARKPKKPLVAWPDDFGLDGGMVDIGLARGFPQSEIPKIWERFRDHHQAKGSMFADWRSAWRFWLGNEIKFQTVRSIGPPGGQANSLKEQRQQEWKDAARDLAKNIRGTGETSSGALDRLLSDGRSDRPEDISNGGDRVIDFVSATHSRTVDQCDQRSPGSLQILPLNRRNQGSA